MSLRRRIPAYANNLTNTHHYTQSALHRTPRALHHPQTRSTSSAPRIVQPSFWRSLIPKPFRSSTSPTASSSPSSPSSTSSTSHKSTNPFIMYAFIFLMIGSNAINQIGIRNELAAFSRKTEAQLGLLKEVIKKVQAGEKIDVEEMLGTGNPEREKEWEEVLAEVGGVQELWERQRRKAEAKAGSKEGETGEGAATDGERQSRGSGEEANAVEQKTEAPKKVGFY